MPTIPFRVTVAIGATVQNAIAGSQFEFIRAPSRVQIYATQDPADLAEIEVFFGQEIEHPPGLISEAAAPARGPVIPDDLIVDDIAAPNDRLVIRLVETGGAATAIVRGLVKVTPIPMG